MADTNPENYASDSEASIEHESSGHGIGKKPKRRRLHGACDMCRKKKIKCDSALMPNKVCTNCANSKLECGHSIPRQKKKETQQQYIQALEERLKKLESYLRMTPPDSLSSRSATTPPEDIPSDASPRSRTKVYPDLSLPVPRTLPGNPTELSPPSFKEEDTSESEDLAHVELAEKLSHLSVDATKSRFFGKSSMFSFAQQATVIKNEIAGIPHGNFARAKRLAFWNLSEWEQEYTSRQSPPFEFPDPDLFASLIGYYFEHIHIYLPLLHRPSFDRDIKRGLHRTDPGFGMVVLAICAIASRYSDDPRVFVDSSPASRSSAGWKYMSQIPLMRNSLVERTQIYDLQLYALTVMYFLGTSTPQSAWNLTGLGIRLAVERGLHRRKGTTYNPTPEEELERRAFWCLICSDRLMSILLGRPPAIHDEDIDVDYPVECDDEYWETEDPAQAFKQPPGKPSIMAAFIYHLKLCEIIGFMMRTLYSTKKSKILTGLVGEEWEQRVVTELDSALNKWKDSLPQHLQWDVHQPDTAFFNQSLLLHATFYYIQIQVHRPFLQKKSPLSLSSFAICTNAARACSHLVNDGFPRMNYFFPNTVMAAFISATVLVINLWGNRKSKVGYDPHKEQADIQKCLDFLREAEKRMQVAGRFADMVAEFCSLHDIALPLPTPPASISHKRPRGGEATPSQHVAPTFTLPMTTNPMDVSPASGPSITPPFKPFMQAPAPQQQQQQQQQQPLHAGNGEWDFNNLLLAQMGYGQTSPVVNLAGGMPPMQSAPYCPPQSFQSFPPMNLANPAGSLQSADAMNLPCMNSDDDAAMAMWMSAPSAFNIEEWDTYISGMVQPI